MKKVFTNGKNNCLSSCVDSILELGLLDCPEFSNINGPNTWLIDFAEWMSSLRLGWAFHHPDYDMKQDKYYIGVIRLPENDHAVVMCNDSVVHDPAIDQETFILDLHWRLRALEDEDIYFNYIIEVWYES